MKIVTKLKKLPRGFTLVETLIAVLLLATAVAGPLTIASKGLSTALVAKDQIVAFFLAQDAVEFVRFARDTNQLRGAANWLSGVGGTPAGIDLSNCLDAFGCYFDSTMQNPSTVELCNDNCEPPFNGGAPKFLWNNNGYYSYNTAAGTKTLFSRKVTMTAISATEIRLEVKVYWYDGRDRSVTVRENIFDWQ